MRRIHGGWLVLIGVFVACGPVGCNGPDAGGPFAWKNPFAEVPDSVPGVVPPYKRMAEYRRLAKEGTKAEPARRQEVAQRLAGEMQAEPDPMIRAQIARTLGAYPTPEAAAALRQALEDSSTDVRIAACKSWGDWSTWGDPNAIKWLNERVASDMDNDVRREATEQLGRTDNPAALTGLSVALDDQSPVLQRQAVLSLREVTNEDLGHDVSRWRQFCRARVPNSETPTAVAAQPDQRFQ
ncbi:MAG: HEAT repeat domain-containing protein [Pirellulales bacterium]|nr:HEAT repeat domain-containing protein [Pirellulales bacterium]